MPALVAVGLWALSPVLAARAGGRVAEALAPLLADTRLARSLVIGLVMPTAAGGAAIALAAPGVTVLGGMLAAAPVSTPIAYGAAVLPRLIAAAALVAPALVAAVAPVTLASAGGASATIAVIALLAAAACAGALVAECALRLVRRRSMPVGLGVPAIVVVCLCAVAEVVVRGIAGASGDAMVGTFAACVLAGATGSTWIVVASERPPDPVRGPRGTPGRRVLPAIESSALAVLRRASDIRMALVTAFSFALVSLVVAGVTGAVGSGVILASGVAMLGAALAPLSAAGRIDAARWAWSVGTPMRIARGWLTATGAAMIAVIGPIAIVGALTGGAAPAVYAIAIALVAWAAGIAAGALVPRRSPILADDAASLAAFVGVLSIGVAAGAAAQELLARAGAPNGAGAIVALGASCAGAAGLLWVRVARV